MRKEKESLPSWDAIGGLEEVKDLTKNIDATFFDVKVSQMLSKYYGESPKIMSALFEVAREEVCAGDCGNEHAGCN